MAAVPLTEPLATLSQLLSELGQTPQEKQLADDLLTVLWDVTQEAQAAVAAVRSSPHTP